MPTRRAASLASAAACILASLAIAGCLDGPEARDDAGVVRVARRTQDAIPERFTLEANWTQQDLPGAFAIALTLRPSEGSTCEWTTGHERAGHRFGISHAYWQERTDGRTRAGFSSLRTVDARVQEVHVGDLYTIGGHGWSFSRERINETQAYPRYYAFERHETYSMRLRLDCDAAPEQWDLRLASDVLILSPMTFQTGLAADMPGSPDVTIVRDALTERSMGGDDVRGFLWGMADDGEARVRGPNVARSWPLSTINEPQTLQGRPGSYTVGLDYLGLPGGHDFFAAVLAGFDPAPPFAMLRTEATSPNP